MSFLSSIKGIFGGGSDLTSRDSNRLFIVDAERLAESRGGGIGPVERLQALQRLAQFSIYRDIFMSKGVTLLLIVIVSVGSRPKKSLELKILRQIVIPLLLGLILIFASVYFSC